MYAFVHFFSAMFYIIRKPGRPTLEDTNYESLSIIPLIDKSLIFFNTLPKFEYLENTPQDSVTLCLSNLRPSSFQISYCNVQESNFDLQGAKLRKKR